ncbi:MAG TPA: PaaI family thioesterase [Rhodospirillaceae bacterium]|nr:PaaI family thioesterase [Rhodospirillaceae bacterium]
MSKMQVKDPEFRRRVTDDFERQQVMKTLGIVLTRLAPGEVDLEFPFDDRLTQQHNFIHAGIIATALDSACGYAAFTLMEAGSEVLTIEFKTNLLSPAIGERFAFRAKVVRSGRTVSVSEGRAYAITGAGEKLVATMTATLMAVSV